MKIKNLSSSRDITEDSKPVLSITKFHTCTLLESGKGNRLIPVNKILKARICLYTRVMANGHCYKEITQSPFLNKFSEQFGDINLQSESRFKRMNAIQILFYIELKGIEQYCWLTIRLCCDIPKPFFLVQTTPALMAISLL